MKTKYILWTLCFAAAFALQAQGPITNGLVAYYPFNGNANDESGNDYNGTVLGATLLADRFGNTNAAYGFNGTNEIIMSSATNLNLSSGGFTICAWAAWTETNVHQVIVGKHVCGYNNGYYLAVNRNKPYFFVGTGAVETSNPLPLDGKWHSVVGRFDGSTQSLYVDAVLIGSMPQTYTSYNSTPLKIGRHSGGAGCFNEGYFIGNIDDVYIYNRALSDLEIQQLFEPGPRVSLQKAVRPAFSGLAIGTNYQLQLSGDLSLWTNHGAPFLATNVNLVFPQYWDVDNWDKLHFRLQLVP